MHRTQRDNIVQMWPTRPPVDLPDLYDTLAERERVARIIREVERDRLILRAQRVIQWACLGIAGGTIVYFIGQLARGAF